MTRIGIVSDTHGQVDFTLSAVRMLESLEVEQVIHCGDIGSTRIVELFGGWPTHFVFGNVDYNERELRRVIEACGQHCHERFGTLELAGRKIAFLHGDDTRLLDQTIRDGQWDLVCHGHTHLARRERIGTTWVLNPGALYRANPHSLAMVELPSLDSTSVAV